MKQARVAIQVIKAYTIIIEVPDNACQGEAIDAAYDMQTTTIEEQGSLQDAESDYAEFQGWVK
jgi:hypothetical protein